MPGVEILSSEVIYEYSFSIWPLIITAVISAIVGFVFMYSDYYRVIDGIFGGLIGIMLGVILGLLVCLFTAQPTGEVNYTKYKVTISDEVNFNEFTERYKILDQEGKIYTVRDRNE